MYNSQSVTITEIARDARLDEQVKYLKTRADNIFYEKDRELERAFHLRDDEAPQSIKEFKERVAAGKFSFYDMSEDDEFSDGFYYGDIRWRDPAVKADRKGYNAAHSKLQAAKSDVMDAIMIKTPAEAFAALEAYKGQTFH